MAKKQKKSKRSVSEKDKKKAKSPIEQAQSDAVNLKNEVKKHIITGITAAFGFLIALTWREPISDLVNMLVDNLSIENEILFKFITAILVTLIAAIVLMYLTRWQTKTEEQQEHD